MKKQKMLLTIIAFTMLLCLNFTGPNYAFCTTLYVDGVNGDDGNDGSAEAPLATVQAAIDACNDDGTADEIIIAPGTYRENLAIEHGDPITLKGDGDGVVIDGDDGGVNDVIRIFNSNVAIRNLKVANGEDGIYAGASSLSLVQVDVSDGVGQGVGAENMSSVTVTGGSFANKNGDVISVRDADEVRIVGASIQCVKNGLILERSKVIEIRNIDVSESVDDGIKIENSDTVVMINSRVSGSNKDGIDIKNSHFISIVNLVSNDNGGNGLLIEAGIDEDPIEHVSVVQGVFSANGKNGVQIVELSDGNEQGQIDEVTLTKVTATWNTESGLYIDFLGDLTLLSVRSANNGEADHLPVSDL